MVRFQNPVICKIKLNASVRCVSWEAYIKKWNDIATNAAVSMTPRGFRSRERHFTINLELE